MNNDYITLFYDNNRFSATFVLLNQQFPKSLLLEMVIRR